MVELKGARCLYTKSLFILSFTKYIVNIYMEINETDVFNVFWSSKPTKVLHLTALF